MDLIPMLCFIFDYDCGGGSAFAGLVPIVANWLIALEVLAQSSDHGNPWAFGSGEDNIGKPDEKDGDPVVDGLLLRGMDHYFDEPWVHLGSGVRSGDTVSKRSKCSASE